jgi:CRP-like cAMP-binding protein
VSQRRTSVLVSDPWLRAELEQIAAPLAKAKNSILFREGQSGSGVFLLTKGKARLSHLYPAIAPKVVGPGAILGLAPTIGNRPYNFTAQLIEDSRLGFIPRREMLRLLRSKPEHCLQIVQLLGSKVREIYSVKARCVTPRRRRRSHSAAA